MRGHLNASAWRRSIGSRGRGVVERQPACSVVEAFVDRDSLASSVSRLQSMQHAVLARQIALTQIPAPTGHEGARAAAFRNYACGVLRGSPAAIAPRIDAAGNVIVRMVGRVRGADDVSPVVVLTHLDTVATDCGLPAVRFDGSRVVLPGIGDNGRGLAAAIALTDCLADHTLVAQQRRPIELVATVGEEGMGNLRGARHYFDDREARGLPTPLAVIAIDGPGDELIVHHGIASQRWRVSLSGPGGHPWADRSAPNAVHAMANIVSAVSRYAAAQAADIVVTVTRIGGGESLTSVPMQAWCEIDMRTLDAARMPRVASEVRRLIHSSRGSLSSQIEILGERPGGSLDVTHPLVSLAAQATRWQDRDPRSASASSDANIPLSRGIPAIAIGGGGLGGGAHTADEWYDDTGSTRGLARALGIVVIAACREPNQPTT